MWLISGCLPHRWDRLWPPHKCPFWSQPGPPRSSLGQQSATEHFIQLHLWVCTESAASRLVWEQNAVWTLHHHQRKTISSENTRNVSRGKVLKSIAQCMQLFKLCCKINAMYSWKHIFCLQQQLNMWFNSSADV